MRAAGQFGFFILCLCWGASAFASALEPADSVAQAQSAWSWQRVPASIGEGGVSALAWDALRGRLALGDARGVALAEASPGSARGLPWERAGSRQTRFVWSRHALSGAVEDLQFGRDGSLWIASESGLWRLDSQSGRLEDRSPAAGERGRFVSRVRTGRLPGTAHEIVLAVGEAGAFLSTDGRRWSRLSDGLPGGAVSRVALRRAPSAASTSPAPAGSLEIWLWASGRLYRAQAHWGRNALKIDAARREPIPGRPSAGAALEIVSDLPGVDLMLLFARALARLRVGPDGGRSWQVWYPVLPAGASIGQLAAAAGRFLLATDRGLLDADALDTRWQRVRGSPGSARVGALVASGSGVWLADGSALFEGRPPAEAGATAPTGLRLGQGRGGGPDLRRIHARALLWAGLTVEGSSQRWRGVRRRGWLPSLSLRAAAAHARDRSDDHDQSFSYGELHSLHDRESGNASDFETSITLSWDLADLAYQPAEVDLSREERQVVTLRDDLLDEVTRLYFDRLRALRALAAFADRRDPQAVELELRARELAAGLDARTGGWFSEQLARAGPPGRIRIGREPGLGKRRMADDHASR